ncbi:hypothetical protein C8Q78DRAFT_1016938 [Trametes maxima]|nr:hypothetical protein C8Q78DRAFT_1016938 [Trametes maxima]
MQSSWSAVAAVHTVVFLGYEFSRLWVTSLEVVPVRDHVLSEPCTAKLPSVRAYGLTPQQYRTRSFVMAYRPV